MTLPPITSFSETSAVLCFVLILLVPLAGIGLALVNTGLGRSRSAAHTMLSSLSAIGVAAVVYLVFGSAWQGSAAGPAHIVLIGHKPWNWIAAASFFFRGQTLDFSPAALVVLLQTFSVGLAALIPLSSGADRWRLGAICASTALLSGWTYPLFAHWVWGGGWLHQLGQNYGLGEGFLDAGGSGTIHALGALNALSLTWILGPRRGKFSQDRIPAALPGHNTVLVLLGCLLMWLGWIGLNCSGAMLFAAAAPPRAVLIVMNTTLAASVAGLTATAVTRFRFGSPDASLCANGWTAGLVASSASAPLVSPAAAILIGIVAGAVVPLAIEFLEFRCAIDDSAGAISVHGLAGIWGLLAVAIFSGAGGSSGQWLAQLIGIATLLGLVLPMSYSLNWLLNRVYCQRVDPDSEMQGMDLSELGAGAYPEFAVYRDEFLQR